jgi:hypothetical protein
MDVSEVRKMRIILKNKNRMQTPIEMIQWNWKMFECEKE